MRTRFKVRLSVNLLIALSILGLLSSPWASPAERAQGLPAKLRTSLRQSPTDFDIRQHQGVRAVQEPTPLQQAELQRLRRQVQGLEIRFNPITGTPRHLFSLTERLTPPRDDDPVTIARDFLTIHRALFRLQDQDLKNLVVAKHYRTQHNGMTHLVFRQLYEGLEVFQAHLKVHVDRNGQILSLSGDYFPGLVAPLHPEISAAVAVQVAASHLEPNLAFTPRPKALATGVQQLTLFDRGPFRDDITAKLVIFPAYDRARLAWATRLHWPRRLAWCDIVLDAQTGELLYRHNLYRFAQPQGLVFELNPDAGPQVVKPFVGDPTASPETWVTPPPNIRTVGNNVLALPAAQNAEQDFRFPFANAYNEDGPNAFDLNMQTLRFTPNAAGGYDVHLVPLKFDTNLGGNFTSTLSAGGRRDADDGFFQLGLGFEFPFFGTNFNIISVNANGFVTFGLHVVEALETWEDLILGPPRIAALWDDLDPGRTTPGGGVFAKVASDSATITWHRIPQFGARDVNTVQLTILRTGVIEISFNGVELTDGLVGVTRGAGEFHLQSVNFLANAPILGQGHGLAQKFPTVELDSAVTNVFYHLNFMHDYLYKLGFDEAAGNFQINNFNRGGVGSDPVLAFAQVGDSNNAFFATPEDGFSPITGYGLFTEPPLRQVDSAFDADVLYHEYVHGLTNRLVGTFNVGALSGFQSAALGEGWSDIFAVSITNDPIIGEYIAGDEEKGIRTVNYSQSPLVFGNFGNRWGPLSALGLSGGVALDMTFIPQEHSDGEIWASALWDARQRLGQQTFEQLITDALKVTPSNPSILDARDAILIADVASHGGAHVNDLWTIFAARGMGFSARTDSGEDTLVFQAFDTPSQPMPLKKETIFFDDMSRGVSGWTVTGVAGRGEPPLWHQSTRRGSFAWYYGREAEGNYASGTFRNYGALTSPAIDLTRLPGDSIITLEFDHFLRGDPVSPLLDNGYVRIVDRASGAVTQLACVNNHTLGGRGGEFFEHEELNISQFAGHVIQVQFYFDTITGALNNAEGWYIDNVRVSRRVR